VKKLSHGNSLKIELACAASAETYTRRAANSKVNVSGFSAIQRPDHLTRRAKDDLQGTVKSKTI